MLFGILSGFRAPTIITFHFHRYRARDAWRSVTRIAVREARLKEIRQEMLNSVKLQSHLADNPRDAQLLKHDKALHTVKHQVRMPSVSSTEGTI